jgi:curved DNA-binding protein CbpA
VTSANIIPTPYQIFNQKKGSPYSKRRFYELVKMYHPDRHNINGVSDGLPYATKLERYRLVIAANEILSDPVKRGAYDCYGAGWNGLPGVKSPRDSPETTDRWDANGGGGWGGGPESPSQNATWEDWERWYQRDERAKQQPTYFSNGTFLSLIIIFFTLGGIGQATRAEKRSMSVQEQRQAMHRGISKDLVHRRNGSATSGDPRERMGNFLRLRSPYNYYLVDTQEEMYRRLLTQPEICSSAKTNTLPINMYNREDKPKAQ